MHRTFDDSVIDLISKLRRQDQLVQNYKLVVFRVISKTLIGKYLIKLRTVDLLFCRLAVFYVDD